MNENLVAVLLFTFAGFALFIGVGSDPIVMVLITNFIAFLGGKSFEKSRHEKSERKLKLPE